MIELHDPYTRFLLPNRQSLVDEYVYLKHRFEQPGKFSSSDFVVPETDDSDHFDYVYDETLTFDNQNNHFPVFSKAHTQEDEENLLTKISHSSRYINQPDYEERLHHEIEFFIRNQYVLLLIRLCELVEQFEQDHVVWGVGRGSSCASLILYYIGIHDIDPVEFAIPFRELSKEGD